MAIFLRQQLETDQLVTEWPKCLLYSDFGIKPTRYIYNRKGTEYVEEKVRVNYSEREYEEMIRLSAVVGWMFILTEQTNNRTPFP